MSNESTNIIETMSAELEHLRPMEASLEMAEADVKAYKQRIAVLKKEVARLQQYHDTEATKWLAENQKLKEKRRWRKCSDEMPSADEGYFIALYEDKFPDIGYIGAEDDVIETIRDRGEGHSVEWWMPLPSAPKEADK